MTLNRNCLQLIVTGAVLLTARPVSAQSWVSIPMSMERHGHTAVPLPSGELLVVGGYLYDDPSGSPYRVERYDPASQIWSIVSDTTGYHAFEDHGALLLDGRVLIVGLEAEEVYDPATDTWSNLPGPTGGAISYSSVTQLSDGDVLIVGGIMDTSAWADTVRLDGASAEVRANSDLNLARGKHSATLLTDGRVLVTGGQIFVDELEQFMQVDDAELYDPATDTWLPVSPLLETRMGHRAASLPDGRVLVAGGRGRASTEIYDPATDSWTPGPAMSDARGGLTLTTLPSGWIVAIGGNGFGGVQGSVEAYDPTIGTWFALPSLTQPRMDHTATYLPGHGLVVTGGATSPWDYNAGVSSSELYPLGTIAEGGVCLMPEECTSGLCDDGVCAEADDHGPGGPGGPWGPGGRGQPGGPGGPGGGCPFEHCD